MKIVTKLNFLILLICLIVNTCLGIWLNIWSYSNTNRLIDNFEREKALLEKSMNQLDESMNQLDECMGERNKDLKAYNELIKTYQGQIKYWKDRASK